jgi:hypothetical protein
VQPPYEWLWYEKFGKMFGGITKINGVPQHNGYEVCFTHFEVQIIKVSDDDVIHAT